MGKLNLTTEQVSNLLAVVATLPAVSDIATLPEVSRDYQPKGNYLTQHQSLADYATVSALNVVSQALSHLQGLHDLLLQRFETLVGDEGNVSSVIDSFREMETFLAGITNQQTLTGLLSDMRAEIVGQIPTGRASQSDLEALAARVTTLEGKANTQGEAVSTLQADMAKRPALPDEATAGSLYAVKNGSYVEVCGATEQLLAAVRSS